MDYAISLPLKDVQDFYAGTPTVALVDKAADKTAAFIRVNLATYIRSLLLLEESSQPFSVRQWIQDEKRSGWLFLLATSDQREALRLF